MWWLRAGFMVGTKYEQEGIIKHGAHMINAGAFVLLLLCCAHTHIGLCVCF